MYKYICSKCSNEFMIKKKNQRFCSKSCANSYTSRNRYSPTKKLYEYKNSRGNDITYTFITTNEYDIEFLRRLEIDERKSKNVKIPNIDEAYVSHVLRGIFDGDGSVYINRTKSKNKVYQYINVSFTTGSERLADDIIKILNKNNIEAHKIKDIRKEISTWYVKIYSKHAIKNFYMYLYTNATIYMNRKKDLFNMMI